jgi:hypothetical protein
MHLMFKRYDNKYKKVRNSKRLLDQARDLDTGLDLDPSRPQHRWLMYVHQWKEPHNQIGCELFFVFKCFIYYALYVLLMSTILDCHVTAESIRKEYKLCRVCTFLEGIRARILNF